MDHTGRGHGRDGALTGLGDARPATPGGPSPAFQRRRWLWHRPGSTQPCTCSQLSPLCRDWHVGTVALGGPGGLLCEARLPRSAPPAHPRLLLPSLFPLEVSSQFGPPPTSQLTPQTLPCWSPLCPHLRTGPLLSRSPPAALPYRDSCVFLNWTHATQGLWVTGLSFLGPLLCPCLLGELLFNLSAPAPLPLPGLAFSSPSSGWQLGLLPG